MAVTQAIACQASTRNVLDSLLEWVQDEFNELNSTVFSPHDASTNPEGRKEVTHVGFGLQTRFDLPRRPLHQGIETSITCRADLFTLDVDPNDGVTEPQRPAPKITINLDLSGEDEGHQRR